MIGPGLADGDVRQPRQPVSCERPDVTLLASVARIAVVLAGLWLLLVVLAAVFQRSLIYLPDASPPGSVPADVEVVAFDTRDGLQLTAWFLPTTDEAASVVLYLPGNAGNRAGRLPVARELNARGHDVLLVDYRGYGGNPGNPSETGLIADGLAAHDHLAARDDVDAARIAVLGESVGTGVAAAVATERPTAGVVLRSPFPDLGEVGASAYPILPVRTLLRDRFATVAGLADRDVEVLVVAGGADRIVPTELSRAVATSLDARYLEIDGVGHNDPALFTGATYLDAVDEHLRAAVGAGG